MDKDSQWMARRERLINRLSMAFPNPYFENWDLCEEHILSATSISNQILELNIETLNSSLLAHKIASFLFEKGRYERVKDLYLFSLRVNLKDKDDLQSKKNSSNVLNGLGSYCSTVGEYSLAEKYFKESLKIKVEMYGKNSLLFAEGVSNLAGIYHLQNKNNIQVWYFYKKSLSIKEKILGENDISIASSLNNLAFFYHKLGRYKKAKSLYDRCLSILENKLPENHPYIAQALNNLGGLCYNAKRYDEAIYFHNRSIKIRENILGKEHPDVATSLTNLSLVFLKIGDYQQAEFFCKQGLLIRRNSEIVNYIDVAGSEFTLIEIYKKQRRYHEVDAMYIKKISILERNLGKYNMHVLVMKTDLAILKIEKMIFYVWMWFNS